MISVLIATKDRPNDLLLCVNSILKNKSKNFEILVLDQSAKSDKKLLQDGIKNKRVRYYKVAAKGKSYALNFGIQKAKGEILAFTDDDCVVSKNWLNSIYETFSKDKTAAMLFGKSMPYKKELHPSQVCPAAFSLNSYHVISSPTYHAKNIGFGNNMAIKKKLYKNIKFKKWLGPGSIGRAAEDAEVALTLLLRGRKIRYNSKILVYHNKWLSPKENFWQGLNYVLGEISCYGYFFFQGHAFAREVIFNNFKDSYEKIKKLIKNLISLRFDRKTLSSTKSTFLELGYRLMGVSIALIYSIIDPLDKTAF